VSNVRALWEIFTECVCRLLASKNLPAAIEDTGGSELPESIREKAQSLTSQGGVGTIESKLYGLPELLQRNKEILEEVCMRACHDCVLRCYCRGIADYSHVGW
jgi:hypothetical protein